MIVEFKDREVEKIAREIDDLSDYYRLPLLVHIKNYINVKCKERKVCLDCGEEGVLIGHMECQYPQDH